MLSAALRAGPCCLAPLVLACSRLGSFAVGPIVSHPTGVEASYGDELRLRRGAGSGDDDALSVIEAQARLAVTERASAVSVGVGPAHLRWAGPLAFTLRAAPMLGAQWFDRTVFASAGLHGGLGAGLVLDEAEHVLPRIWTIGPPMTERETIDYRRDRTLLTLELSGSADVQARGVTLSAGILIGLAWSEEHLTRERPSFLLQPRGR